MVKGIADRPGALRLQAQPAHVRRRPNAVQAFLKTSAVPAKVAKPGKAVVQRGLFD